MEKARRRPKVRKVIDDYATGQNLVPQYIDHGAVFLFPSQSDLGSYHTVVWFEAQRGRPEQFLCDCKGFRYSTTNVCRHVTELRKQMKELILA